MNTKRKTLVLAVLLSAAAATLAVNEARADAISIWGGNGLGELGDGTTIDHPTPGSVPGLTSGVTAVAAGQYYSVAVQDGAAYAWGYNANGALGIGTTDPTRSLRPVPVIGLGSGVTAVAAGVDHSLAVQNGAVYGWGYNGFGALGNGTTTGGVTPVAVSAPMTSGVTAIAAGDQFSLALKNGGVWAWGFNLDGELGDGTTINRNAPVAVSGLGSGVTAIAAGYTNGLAVQNGAVYALGTTGSSPIAVTGLANGATAVAAGRYHSLAVRNGGVYAWGLNNYGQLGDGTTTADYTPEQIDPADLHNIIAVAAGQNSSYALSSDGSLWDWGDNTFGEMGLGNTFQSSYLTPQHLLPPSGFRFTSIDANVTGYSFAITTLATVPEPSTFVLAALGFLGLVVCRQYRRCIRLLAALRPARTSQVSVVPAALLCLVTLLATAFATCQARAQNVLLVANSQSNIIGEYDASTGATIKANFITTSASGVHHLALDGNNHLFVSDSFQNAVSEYNATTGAIINATFISGLNVPFSLALDGNNHLFVGNTGVPGGTVGEYNATTGAAINANFINVNQGLDSTYALALDTPNNRLFVADAANNNIAQFDATTGATISFGFSHHDTFGLAFDGLNHLFITGSQVEELDATTGATINGNFITGFLDSVALALDGNNHMFVTDAGANTVGEYNATTGATMNATLVQGLNEPGAIVFSSAVPEPSTFALAGIGVLSYLTCIRQRRRRSPYYLNRPKASVI